MKARKGPSNKGMILELLRSAEMRTRIELSQITGLSLPTVMKWVDEFIAKGIVLDGGVGASTGGKPPRLLRFNYQSHHIVGIDINGSRIDVVLMDLAANVLRNRIRDIGSYNSFEQVVSYVCQMIHAVLEGSGLERNDILGIGVGISGVVDHTTGFLRRFPAFGWENVDLIAPIQRRFGLPVIVENDAHAAAMGEKLVGIAADYKNFVYINIGDEANAALVVGGALCYGQGTGMNTFGHFTVDRNGLKCACGRRGCLNTIVTPGAIERKTREALANLRDGQGSLILDMAYGHMDRVNIYTIIDAAENGDALAVNILKMAARCLAAAIVNITCLVCPEAIILDGKLLRNSHTFLEELRGQVQRESALLSGNPIPIRLSSLGKHLCAIGVASMILNQFIENGGDSLSLRAAM